MWAEIRFASGLFEFWSDYITKIKNKRKTNFYGESKKNIPKIKVLELILLLMKRETELQFYKTLKS